MLDCMCGNVIAGRFDPSKPFFTDRGSFWTGSTTDLLAGTTEKDRQGRTRNKCNSEGYESMALIVLSFGEERMGFLQINDRERGRPRWRTSTSGAHSADYLAIALVKFQTEKALAESEELYRSPASASPDAIAVVKRRWNGPLRRAQDV